MNAARETATSHDIDDELGATITHTIGVVLSIPVLVALLLISLESGAPPLQVAGFGIYGTTLVALFVASSLYHAVATASLSLNTLREISDHQLGLHAMPVKVAVSGALRRWLRACDHACIAFLMAGAATPLVANYWFEGGFVVPWN